MTIHVNLAKTFRKYSSPESLLCLSSKSSHCTNHCCAFTPHPNYFLKHPYIWFPLLPFPFLLLLPSPPVAFTAASNPPLQLLALLLHHITTTFLTSLPRTSPTHKTNLQERQWPQVTHRSATCQKCKIRLGTLQTLRAHNPLFTFPTRPNAQNIRLHSCDDV